MSKPSDTGALTIDQFLHLLSNHPTKDWVVTSSGRLRLKNLSDTWRARGHIFDTACPIEVVAGKVGASSRAGPALGLSDDDIRKIMHAADNYKPDPALRARLMEACGIGAGAQ